MKRLTKIFRGGAYERKPDEKRRVRIPKEWRGETEAAYICDGGDFLMLKFSEAASTPLCHKVGLDTEGRVMLPDMAAKAVGLKGSVVLAGYGDHIKIWPPEKWEEERQRLLKEQSLKPENI